MPTLNVQSGLQFYSLIFNGLIKELRVGTNKTVELKDDLRMFQKYLLYHI